MSSIKPETSVSGGHLYSTIADPPSTHMLTEGQVPVVGEDTPQQYHTETVPCTRNITPEEAAQYSKTPTTIVGKKFMPKNGEEIWEVSEVAFGEAGWNSVIQFEGQNAKHNMIFEDFMRMLKQGVLIVVELE